MLCEVQLHKQSSRTTPTLGWLLRLTRCSCVQKRCVLCGRMSGALGGAPHANVPRRGQLDKLVISQLGLLAQRRLARGVKLNHAEATVRIPSRQSIRADKAQALIANNLQEVGPLIARA
jgi:hypothetical protein